jgi:hypothetical protein
MPFSQGSRSELAYIVESTFGVTPPSSPQLTALPFSTSDLNLSKEILQSPDIRADRAVDYYRHGNRQIGGDIAFALRADDLDDVLESAFFNTFSTGVLKIGTTQQSLTIEERSLDITQFRRFTGCVVSQLQVNCQVNATVNCTASIVGKDMTTATSPLDASITAYSANDPFDTYSGAITEGGSTIAIVTSVNFSIQNNVSPTFVLGSAATPQLEYGRSIVTGTLEAYFQDMALMNKFLNETESSLQIAMTTPSAADTYTWLFPRIKYNGGSVPIANEQSRIISMPFAALYDTSTSTMLQLTKS